MTREEELLSKLCLVLWTEGLHSQRFHNLWLESGLKIDDEELNLAQHYFSTYTSSIPINEIISH